MRLWNPTELLIAASTWKFNLWPAAQLEDRLWSAFHFGPGVNQLPDAAAFCARSWESEEIKERLLITQSKYGLWFQKAIRREGGSCIEMPEDMCVYMRVGEENELRGVCVCLVNFAMKKKRG